MNERPLRWTRGARKHKIGRYHAEFVMQNNQPIIENGEYAWLGLDDRGVELEIIAVMKPDCLLVIHVFPTDLRKLGRRRME